MAATLMDLERLQKKADRLNAEQDLEFKLKKEVASLHKKAQRLRKRKTELLMKLRESPSHILHQCVKDTSEPGCKIKLPADSDKETIGNTLQELQRRQLLEVFDAYRLTGISVVSQEAKKVCFRCETFFNGEYFEPYYIEILKGAELTLGRNTIPYFIPLETLVEDHLNSELKLFLIILGQYLNAFVSRRQQVCLLSEQFQAVLRNTVYTSPAYDFVKFTVKAAKTEDMEVQLHYNDFLHKLPSDVTIKIKSTGKVLSGSSHSSLIHQRKELFKQLSLHEAFSEAFI